MAKNLAAKKGNRRRRSFAEREHITCIAADPTHVVVQWYNEIRICVDQAVVTWLHRWGTCPCIGPTALPHMFIYVYTATRLEVYERT
jgi:hypothetical protein